MHKVTSFSLGHCGVVLNLFPQCLHSSDLRSPLSLFPDDQLVTALTKLHQPLLSPIYIYLLDTEGLSEARKEQSP